MSDEERRVYEKTHWMLDHIENMLGEIPDPEYTIPFCRSFAHEVVQMEVEFE